MTRQAIKVFQEYKTSLGFWIYLMTDCILFATLFATYVVLRPGVASGPLASEIVDLPLVLVSTIILLSSSLTCGIALLAMKQSSLRQTLGWLGLTYVLGVAFLTIEAYEFSHLIANGHGWWESAFLSGFFVLVGAHGAHILIGLLWLLVLVAVLYKRGITTDTKRQLTLFGLFWHFLDLVWIFIFTVVYLMGAIS